MALVFIIKGNLDIQRDTRNVSAERKDHVKTSEVVSASQRERPPERPNLLAVKNKTTGLKGIL